MSRLPIMRVTMLLAGAVLLVLLPTGAAQAHPLGNFTRNVYAGLTVSPDRLTIDRVVDLAEIPAFQERQQMDTNRDGSIEEGEAATYRDQACATQAGQLRVTGSGGRLRLHLDSTALSFPPGAGGLATLRLQCALSAPLGHTTQLSLDDQTYADRLGWHEIAATGARVTLVESDVPRSSLSHRLTTYPADLLQSPLERRTAHLRWTATSPVATPQHIVDSVGAAPRGVDAATRAFTGLIGRQRLTVAFGLIALLLAVALGGLHALAPGHGKTLMAGFLLGVGGRVRDAVTIGLAVTITHTAGVLMLGLLLAASAEFAPEKAYPWLGLASGLLALAIGASLLRAALARRSTASERRVDEYAYAGDLVSTGAGRSPRLQHAPEPGQPSQHDRVHEHPGHHHLGHRPVADHHHADDHGEGHHHHGHSDHQHSHGPIGHSHPPPPGPVSLPGLISLGLAGGLIPSPSALVVLLAGFSQHRAWFALVLVTSYGAGMAMTLVATGLLLVRARAVLERLGRRRVGSGPLAWLVGTVPVAAACAVIFTGGYLVIKAVASV
jgi:nickel/cobalt exporter